MTRRLNTWPVASCEIAGWTYLGIPDRLGDGRLRRIGDEYPSLEEIAGDGWSTAILRLLLADARPWAWWTRSEAFKASRLPNERAPDRVSPASLDRVLRRRLLLQGMTLAFIPAADRAARETVLEWAGTDSEVIADVIWTAPERGDWEPDAIISWCSDPNTWTDPRSVPKLPAERVAVLFDERIFCALPAARAAETIDRVNELAVRWQLSIIPGPTQYAWPVLARDS